MVAESACCTLPIAFASNLDERGDTQLLGKLGLKFSQKTLF
jgi:hypothetical protein